MRFSAFTLASASLGILAAPAAAVTPLFLRLTARVSRPSQIVQAVKING
jgi:hypothetical protein